MPLLRDEAAKLSQDDMVRGIIEEFADKDDLFGILPFSPTTGKALVYNREKTLATGDWLDPNDEVKEGASTFDEVTTRLRILIGDVDVDKFIDGTMSDVNSQKAIQIASKVKGMRTQFRDALINGLQANKQFDGLNALVHANQVINAGGHDMAFSMFDELTDAIRLGANCVMMRSEHIRAYKAMLRLMGGNTGGRSSCRTSTVRSWLMTAFRSSRTTSSRRSTARPTSSRSTWTSTPACTVCSLPSTPPASPSKTSAPCRTRTRPAPASRCTWVWRSSPLTRSPSCPASSCLQLRLRSAADR